MQLRTATREATREVLVFVLGREEYAVDILKVQEIRGYDQVTPIPNSPSFLKGMVNIRGIIVPVIDLRVKFGLEARKESTTVMIVLRIGHRMIGMVVDGVSDTLPLAASDIKPAPTLGGVVDATYLAGLATKDDRMILMLDIEHLLSSGELNILAQAAQEARSGT
jgi:purine-binding chemotaxis protein CheW